jgi:hypothetical protein
MESGAFNFTLIVPVIMMLAGVGICLFGAYRWQQFNAMAAWPSTQGKVLRSQLRASDGLKSADVEYEYRVIGTRYVSTHRSAGISDSDTNADDIVTVYPVGESVTVFYNPENPQEAMLERGNNVLALALIGAGAVDIMMGIGFFFYFSF